MTELNRVYDLSFGIQALHRQVGKVILYEDFTQPQNGFTNYGAALAFCARDTEVGFQGKPSMRVWVPSGTNTGRTDPGVTTDASASVAERHIPSVNNQGRYAMSWWQRLSYNITSNAIVSARIFSRDSVNNHMSTIWFNTAVAGQIGLYALSAGVYTQFGTYLGLDSTAYTFNPTSANVDADRAGNWSYCRLVIDFGTNAYVGFQFNESYFDLSSFALNTAADSGTQALHIDFELARKTSSDSFISVAEVALASEAP